MSPKSLLQTLLVLAAAHLVSSATYSRSSSLSGQAFLNAFDWTTDADPNYGRVNYIDYSTAQSKGLVSVSGNKVTLRADSSTVLNATGPGRDSFDLVSVDQYTTHVAIFDMAHMPEGCGTWPAVCECGSLRLCSIDGLTMCDRELGNNWPNGGELDIVEGVNNQGPNLVTLHTSADCTMPSFRAMSGTSKGTNCNVYQTGNTACGVSVPASDSFGPSFNSAGGGWYAIERTASFIKVFFWSRQGGSVPAEVSTPGSSIDTDNWGTPVAYFPSSVDCDFSTHLSPFNIVINLDFCGAWAGNSQVYGASGCPSNCADYVDANPSAFQNAYFAFNALNIYE